MKKINLEYVGLITILLLTTFSCKSYRDNNIYGDWNIYHIFYNDEEILDNDFENNGWNVEYHRTKSFFVIKGYDQFNIYLDRHGSPITGNFRFVKTDSVYFEMYDTSDERFNGFYSKDIFTDTIMSEGLKVVYYYMKLESDDTTILALKNNVLNKTPLF